MTPLEMVKQFHSALGQPIGESPHLPSEDRELLRLSLLNEEYGEVMEALRNRDLSNLAKELADLVYVTYGFAIEAGIDLDSVLEEVHRSNMSKMGADGKPIYRADGKVLKGPNYFEADVDSILGL